MKAMLNSFFSKILLIFIVTCTTGMLNAQKYSREYGIIARDEFDLTSYEPDPEAEAVVLFDIGESFFEYSDSEGYNIRFTRTKRIKILSSAGLDYANIQIPYYVDGYGRTEKVYDIEATVYNQTNNYSINKSYLNEDAIYDEQKNKYYRVKKFALPEVREGSVIEYKYTHWTPFKFNLPDWQFQDRIPTVYSEYTVKMIPFYEYIYTLQGGELDEKKSYEEGDERNLWGITFNDYVTTFIKKDIPAFKDETLISSVDDYILKMDFQLSKVHNPTGGVTEVMTSWAQMIEDYLDHEDFGKYIKQANKQGSKTVLPNFGLEGLSEAEKAKKIIEYVKSNYSWNRYYAKFAREKLKKFLEKKEGNAAEINMYTLGLLQAAGLDAKPVVISTRDHGKVYSNYPFNHYFNYVIILLEIDGKLVLTDATEPLLAYDRIPPFCINDYGLIVDDQEVNFIDVRGFGIGVDLYQINLTIDPDSLKSTFLVSNNSRDMSAYIKKDKFGDQKDKIQEHMEQGNHVQIEKVVTRNFDKNEAPYQVFYSGELNLERINEKILVRPLLNIPPTISPLKQKSRNYPVDFIFKTKDDYRCYLNIPEGYQLEYVPEPLEISNDLLDLVYSSKINAGRLEIKASCFFKKAIYAPEEYVDLKNYYDQMVKKFNEMVIFSPKG